MVLDKLHKHLLSITYTHKYNILSTLLTIFQKRKYCICADMLISKSINFVYVVRKRIVIQKYLYWFVCSKTYFSICSTNCTVFEKLKPPHITGHELSSPDKDARHNCLGKLYYWKACLLVPATDMIRLVHVM